jgi:hypothetical protein
VDSKFRFRDARTTDGAAPRGKLISTISGHRSTRRQTVRSFAEDFIYYIDRHIELDGDSHGPMGRELLSDLRQADADVLPLPDGRQGALERPGSREGPTVCRLAAGGKRIRTAGPTCDRDAD